MAEEEKHTADCYSAGERRWMELGQRWRGRWLLPLLEWLTYGGVSADWITLASLAAGVLFVPLWTLGWLWTAVCMLGVHVLLDGLDGPLARFQSSNSQRGSFTDSFCDQVIVSVVTIALMSGPEPLVDIWGGSLFVVLYTGVLAMAMVRNALNRPYSWLVRPRFFLFAAIAFELLGVDSAVMWVVWLSNLLLTLKAVSGFFRLRSALPGQP